MNFDLNKLSGDDAKALVKSLATGFQATIQNQQTASEKLISTLVLDLSVARTRNNPIKVSFPFVSLRVEEATDSFASCRVIPVTIDGYQDDTLLKLNDSLEFDNGISALYVTNTAQAGKSLIIKFYTTGRVRSGSLILAQNSGTSSINIGRGTGANDGLTLTARVKTGNSGTLPTNASGGRFVVLQGLNDKSNYNGVGSIGGSGNTDLFKVPAGYKCELIGAEYVVPVAVTATSFSCYLFGIPQGYNDTLANLIATSTVKRVYTDFVSTLAINLVPTKLQFLIDFNNAAQLNQVWNENESIGMYVLNFDAANNAGRVEFDLIFRLTKIVGA